MPEPETLGEISRRVQRVEDQIGRDLRDLRDTCAQQASASVQQAVYAVHRENDRQDLVDLTARVTAVQVGVDALKQANADRVAVENARYRKVFATAITGVALPVLVAFLVLLMRGGV